MNIYGRGSNSTVAALFLWLAVSCAIALCSRYVEKQQLSGWNDVVSSVGKAP